VGDLYQNDHDISTCERRVDDLVYSCHFTQRRIGGREVTMCLQKIDRKDIGNWLSINILYVVHCIALRWST
jgi:hypothetical protein